MSDGGTLGAMDVHEREKIQHVINYLAPTYHGQPAEVIRAALDAELAKRGLDLEPRFRADITAGIVEDYQVVLLPQ